MCEEKKFFSMEYAREVVMKIIDNLLSVKVWIVVGVLALTSTMVYDGVLSGEYFAGINTVLITTVAAMREVFKVNKVRALVEVAGDKIKDMKE